MPDEENYYTDEDLLKESIKFVLSWFLQVPRPLSSGTSYIDSRGNSTQHFDFFFFSFVSTGNYFIFEPPGSQMIKLAGLSSPYRNFSAMTRSRISLLSNYSLERMFQNFERWGAQRLRYARIWAMIIDSIESNKSLFQSEMKFNFLKLDVAYM